MNNVDLSIMVLSEREAYDGRHHDYGIISAKPAALSVKSHRKRSGRAANLRRPRFGAGPRLELERRPFLDRAYRRDDAVDPDRIVLMRVHCTNV
jgi:hypothetical protein